MRIETWDLKEGDFLLIHNIDATRKYVGELMKKPFEVNYELWAKCKIIFIDNFVHHFFITFNDNKNLWELTSYLPGDIGRLYDEY